MSSQTNNGADQESGFMGFLKNNKGMLIGGVLAMVASFFTGGGMLPMMLMGLLGAFAGGIFVDKGQGALSGLINRGTVPGTSAPGATVPGATTPGATVPDATTPAATVPGATVPAAPTIDETQLRATLTASATRTEQLLLARNQNFTLNDNEKTLLRNAIVESGVEVVRANPALAQNPHGLQQALIDNIINNPNGRTNYAVVNNMINQKTGNIPIIKDMVISTVRHDLTLALNENRNGLVGAVAMSSQPEASPDVVAPIGTGPVPAPGTRIPS